MTDPARRIGERLRAARQRADVSQSAVAAHLGVTQTAVSYWEAGRRLPGIDDLMKIADLLHVSLAELLPDEAERKPTGAVLRAVALQVDDATLAHVLDEFVTRAGKIPAPSVEVTVRASGARDAAEQLLDATGARELPINVDDLARRCGVRVLKFNYDKMVDGLVVQLPDGPVIGLNAVQLNEQRCRFTLAHELGHHILGHSSSFVVDFSDVGGAAGDSPGYNWRHERAANEFAANLLMPAEYVRREAGAVEEVTKLARLFDVSKQAMVFRLTTLGLRQGPLE